MNCVLKSANDNTLTTKYRKTEQAHYIKKETTMKKKTRYRKKTPSHVEMFEGGWECIGLWDTITLVYEGSQPNHSI